MHHHRTYPLFARKPAAKRAGASRFDTLRERGVVLIEFLLLLPIIITVALFTYEQIAKLSVAEDLEASGAMLQTNLALQTLRVNPQAGAASPIELLSDGDLRNFMDRLSNLTETVFGADTFAVATVYYLRIRPADDSATPPTFLAGNVDQTFPCTPVCCPTGSGPCGQHGTDFFNERVPNLCSPPNGATECDFAPVYVLAQGGNQPTECNSGQNGPRQHTLALNQFAGSSLASLANSGDEANFDVTGEKFKSQIGTRLYSVQFQGQQNTRYFPYSSFVFLRVCRSVRLGFNREEPIVRNFMLVPTQEVAFFQ